MWTSFITYFKATGAQARANVYDGLWLNAVVDAAAGQALVDDATVQARVVAKYGTGELRRTNAAVDIPHLATPAASFGNDGYYDEDSGAVQTEPLVQFPGRAAVGIVHDRYEELFFLLHQLGPHYPPEDVLAADRLLFAMHGGIFRVFNEGANLTPQQMLFWLSRQALGPGDGTQASVAVPVAGGGSLDITMPKGVAELADGNDWSVSLSRAANAGAQSLTLNMAEKRIEIVTIAQNASVLEPLIAALEFNDITRFLTPVTTWSAANVGTTGADGALAEVPAQASNDPVIYEFTGGVQAYNPNHPETIAPMIDAIPEAERITTGAMFIASPGPINSNWGADLPILGTRLTLAQTFSATMQTGADIKPGVADLQAGAWRERIMF